MRPKRSGSSSTTNTEKPANTSGIKDSEDTTTSSGGSPESKVAIIVGGADDSDDQPMELEIKKVKVEENNHLEHSKSSEEPEELPPKIVSQLRESMHSARSSTFTPPPALSPAHSLQEEIKEEEMEMEVEVEVAPKKTAVSRMRAGSGPGIRKITSSPAMVRMEKNEKVKYKKKDKDAVPHVDPNAPKRNRSAYVHFIIHRRASYSKAVMSQRDINISLAADWTKLSQEDRKPFHEKAEEEKQKYIELMEEYKKTDSHKEFQQKRSQFISSQANQRKRKADSDSDDDEKKHLHMAFPKTESLCPLLNPDSGEGTSSAAVSSGLQFAGPIFTPEFVNYNKIRDTYRRQLTTERSNVEHELEALNEHHADAKIQKQVARIRSIDEKTEEAMKMMRSALAGVAGAKDHLTDIDSLTDWLQTVIKMGARDNLRKSVRESLIKHSKTIKK